MEKLNHAFLENGERVIIIDELKSGFLIERYMGYQDWECEYNERPSGVSEFAEKVYKTEPVSIYSESVVKAKENLSDINGQISEKRVELKLVSDEIKSIEEMCKNNKALNHIFDFINGDFEYFAFPDCYNGDYIRSKNSTLSDEGERYDRDTKLLTLYGRAKGDLQWCLNRYSDGSGGDFIVVPCKTAEDAKEAVASYMIGQLDGFAKNDNYLTFIAPRYCEWLSKNGYEVGENHLIKAIEIAKKEEDRVLKVAQKDYDRALKVLNNAKAAK